MGRLSIVFIVLAAIGAAGCAAKEKPSQKYYTTQEHTNMTYCVGMADTAIQIATQKMKNVPKQELIIYYTGKDNARMNIALVEKIYNTEFKNGWDYTILFFDECALQMAGVPKNRIHFASFCARNALIADVAFAYKKYGVPKTDVYKQFKKYNEKTSREIIDRVYASSKSRALVKLDEWNSCMIEISRD